MGVNSRQVRALIAGASALLIALAGCGSNAGDVATTNGSLPTSPMTAGPLYVAGGDWMVPQNVGIGEYALVTDADAVEILEDKNASPADTHYVNNQAFLQFSKDGPPTAAEMLNFSFYAELMDFYQAQANEQRPTSSPEVQELDPIGIAVYRKVDNASTIAVRKITGPNVGEDAEMCTNSGTANGETNNLGVCRVVRDGNIYLFEVRGPLEETAGKLWVNEFLVAMGLIGLTN